MKTFEDILTEQKKKENISNNKKFIYSKENFIFDNELVKNIKDMKSNNSLESIIVRFEKIDRNLDLISLEENILNKEIIDLRKKEKVIHYLSDKKKKFSTEAGVPYLNYFTNWTGEFNQDQKKGDFNIKNFALAMLETWANRIVVLINIIIKIINVGISFVLNIVQFISTQFLKLLAKKSIPQKEFDIKMTSLKQDSFKKNLKTRYQINVGDIMIIGLRNFSKFGIFTEEKYKWLLDKYEEFLNKCSFQEPKDVEDIEIHSRARVILEPYMNELYTGLKNSLEKDFFEKTLASYRNSYMGTVQKGLKEEIENIKNATLNTKEKMDFIDNNLIMEMSNQCVKVIFGLKEKAEPVDLLEFFRLNAGILTDTKTKELDTFISLCKKSVANYKTFSKILQNRSHKFDTGKNMDDTNEFSMINKIKSIVLIIYYRNMILPFTRFTCSLINYVRRGFVLEFYKLKVFMLSLWNKATFYKDGESDNEFVDNSDIEEADVNTSPSEVLRIAEIPSI